MKKESKNFLSLARTNLRILSPKDRRKLILTSVIQSCTSVLDIVGVAAIGVMGTISVANLKETEVDSSFVINLQAIGIQNMSYQSQLVILAFIALVCFLTRTVVSVVFTRRILYFMSHQGSYISSNLVKNLLSQPLLTIQKRTVQETIWLVTRGVEIIVLEVIAPLAILFSDIVLLVLMMTTLLIVSPLTAGATFFVFGITAFLLNRAMRDKTERLGLGLQTLNIQSNEKIGEVLSSFRESIVRNRQSYYSQEIHRLRYKLANSTAEVNFMPLISKYVFEFVVIFGGVVIGAYYFIFTDTSKAVTTMMIFLAASSRIAPAVLRIQQGLLQIRRGMSTSNSCLELILNFEKIDFTNKDLSDGSTNPDFVHIGFEPQIIVNKVSFTYPDNKHPAISEIDLKIDAGQVVAIVGPSGSGKTTLVDMILGILQPDFGSISISGVKPTDAIKQWPSAIAYVPQDITVANGTLIGNVMLGFPEDSKNFESAINALKISQLGDFVNSLPAGIFTEAGERGSNLSGGQRQRLGVARALFTKPRLLVLDEATSALDSETEFKLSEAIQLLRGEMTIIMIAHRLATVRNADLIVYLEDGMVRALGSFSDIQKAIPNFALHSGLIEKENGQ
jgi:ABC-type multidrug transport system fused ATPase/permease subunit